MTPEERAALEAELAVLRRKVDKRRDEPGFAANVRALDGRIADIEALLVVVEPDPVEPEPEPPVEEPEPPPEEPPTEPEPEPTPDDGGYSDGIPLPVGDEG